MGGGGWFGGMITTFPLDVNMLPLPGIAKDSGMGTCKFQSRHLLKALIVKIDRSFLFDYKT